MELDAIYAKLRRLTSMCYPKYESAAPLANKMRMKPPLVRMRLGELYGHQHDRAAAKEGSKSTDTIDQLGFIKSLTYTVPDSATWEFRRGQRVPKLIDCSINFQMIHESPPDILTQFHGYIGARGFADLKALSGNT